MAKMHISLFRIVTKMQTKFPKCGQDANEFSNVAKMQTKFSKCGQDAHKSFSNCDQDANTSFFFFKMWPRFRGSVGNMVYVIAD